MIEKIRNMIAFASPVRVIERPDSLLVQDFRPTLLMAFMAGGFVACSIFLVVLLVNLPGALSQSVVWIMAVLAILFAFVAAQQSIREVYYFDLRSDSYRFIRQYVHRKEVIEGSLDQFTGARVETVEHDETESYHVVLTQEGMFLTGVTEQTLREVTPIFNSFSSEARIANAISSIVSTARHERSKKKSSTGDHLPG